MKKEEIRVSMIGWFSFKEHSYKRAYEDGSRRTLENRRTTNELQELPTHLRTLTSVSLLTFSSTRLSLSLSLSVCLSVSHHFPPSSTVSVLRHRVITTRSTMGGNHWRLFTATSSARQLISVALISFFKKATQELPMDEHKSSNPSSSSPSSFFLLASCY